MGKSLQNMPSDRREEEVERSISRGFAQEKRWKVSKGSVSEGKTLKKNIEKKRIHGGRNAERKESLPKKSISKKTNLSLEGVG